MKVSVEQFAHDVVACGLLTATELEPFKSALPNDKWGGDASGLAKKLVSAGKLTKYQAANAVQGKAKNLIFGEYVVLAAIGAGGMGQVFKAEHRRMKRVVALKILPPSAVKSTASVQRFQREMQAAGRLEHPNIVTAHDAGEANGVHFLVMQYVEGHNLALLVGERGPLPPSKATNYILQAARGLAYAHGKGVIHRDVKPANLLLDEKGTIKILDLGLARLDGSLTPAPGTNPIMTAYGDVMGTADYMAPEQAEDAHQADARADVYSLGCTLYFLLTAEPPYLGATLVQKMMAHREHPIPSLSQKRPQVPPALDRVFAHMVAKRPADRLQTMHDVMTALAPVELPVSGTVSPTTETISAAANAPLAPTFSFSPQAKAAPTLSSDAPVTADKPTLLKHDVVRKTWSATAKLGGALFATIIAPILVTLILKYFDKPPVEQNVSSGHGDGGTENSSALNETTEASAKAEKPQVPNLVPGKPVDVLAAIDPARDTLRGAWTIRDGVLHAPETPRGHAAQLRLPIAPPSEYDLILSVSRLHTNYGISVSVIVDDRYLGEVFIDGLLNDGSRCWALQMIDGKPASTNGARATNKQMLSVNPTKIVIKVRRGAVAVTCDGAPIFDWRGSGQQLSLPKSWTDLLDEPVMRMVTLADIEIHEITLVPGGGDWKPLFNGRSLEQWTADDLTAWQVDKEKGELIGTVERENRWLFSQRHSYGDFRLRLEFDMKPGTNSGVAIRAKKGDKELEQMQLELCNDPSKCGNISTGTHVGVAKDLNVPPASPVHLKPAGSWNELEMELYKNRLRVWLNGQWLHDLDLAKVAANATIPALTRKDGRIGLQVAGGQIRFRNLVIHELKR